MRKVSSSEISGNTGLRRRGEGQGHSFAVLFPRPTCLTYICLRRWTWPSMAERKGRNMNSEGQGITARSTLSAPTTKGQGHSCLLPQRNVKATAKTREARSQGQCYMPPHEEVKATAICRHNRKISFHSSVPAAACPLSSPRGPRWCEVTWWRNKGECQAQ